MNSKCIFALTIQVYIIIRLCQVFNSEQATEWHSKTLTQTRVYNKTNSKERFARLGFLASGNLNILGLLMQIVSPFTQLSVAQVPLYAAPIPVIVSKSKLIQQSFCTKSTYIQLKERN
jgi:hypothetical protein